MKIYKRPTVIAALAVSIGCGGDETCVPPPCPFAVAIDASIRSATGLTIPNAVIQELDPSGNVAHSTDCAGGDCFIGQRTGTHHLAINAPHFVRRDTTMAVTGTDGGRCSCTFLDTKQLAITLIVDPTTLATPPSL